MKSGGGELNAITSAINQLNDRLSNIEYLRVDVSSWGLGLGEAAAAPEQLIAFAVSYRKMMTTGQFYYGHTVYNGSVLHYFFGMMTSEQEGSFYTFRNLSGAVRGGNPNEITEVICQEGTWSYVATNPTGSFSTVW